MTGEENTEEWDKENYTYLITAKDKIYDEIEKIQEWDKYKMYHNQILQLIP